MKKILYVAISDVHLRTFHVPYLKWLKSQGFEVHIAAAKKGEVDFDFCDSVNYLSFMRSPFHWRNIGAFICLKRIIRNNNYDLIHCHTPAVSVLTRLAAMGARKKGTRILYTAHGYHFFKGAPWYVWLLYYPIEKLLSLLTDGIITINKEDYELTRAHFWAKSCFYIKGVGVDGAKFKPVLESEKTSLKKKFGYGEDAFLLLYIAEFIPRKNHDFFIRCVPALKQKIPNVKIVFAGTGPLLERSKELAEKLKVSSEINFLGWRNDVSELAAIADVGVSTSKQEGLGLGIAEEMLCAVPVVASDDRGHREMIVNGVNGFMYRHGNAHEFLRCVELLWQNFEMREAFGIKARFKAQEFLIDRSLESMAKIYGAILK